MERRPCQGHVPTPFLIPEGPVLFRKDEGVPQIGSPPFLARKGFAPNVFLNPSEACGESGLVQAELRATPPQTLSFAQGDRFKATSCAKQPGRVSGGWSKGLFSTLL